MQHARTTSAAASQNEAVETQPRSFAQLLSDASHHIALLAASIATGGSLFFSEVLGWTPCLLCWYQRIAMYPLTVLLTVGILRGDRKVRWYVLPLALIGAPISLYHYLLIKTNLFPEPPCINGVSCTVDYIDWFGFINIPFMALTAFLIIITMMAVSARVPAPADLDDEELLIEDDEPASGLDWPTVAVFGIIAAVVVAFIVGSAFVA